VWRWSSFDRWTVGQQMVRSADSIGANIAEAAGRRTDPGGCPSFCV
jgi:four helix bundle protein